MQPNPTPPAPPPPGWYPDNTGQPRWWDGIQWTAAPAPSQGGGRITIHYGFALLAIFALIGTAFPCIVWLSDGVNTPDGQPNFGATFGVLWGLWGGMWTVIWIAFAINHTLKSRR